MRTSLSSPGFDFSSRLSFCFDTGLNETEVEFFNGTTILIISGLTEDVHSVNRQPSKRIILTYPQPSKEAVAIPVVVIDFICIQGHPADPLAVNNVDK